MLQVHQFLAETAARALPRILTQICRDPGAPFYGACDRNWWHYKIRDFPSIIIQQAGYALATAATLPSNKAHATRLNELAAATARFWNQRAILHGAFEEYYPYEQGYPPVAFATLAVAKLCHQGQVPLAAVRPGLVIAAKQLLTRFEAEAANQQIAGTAALSVIRTLAPSLIDESAFQDILTKILNLQHAEGWFPEYDGPDLGYLAVSIDCLYDIHDHTSDPRILPTIRKAADFIAWFTLSPLGSAGMHNSRNTDYVTPYGLVRLALEENNPRITATVEKLFTRDAEGSRDQVSGDRGQREEIRGQGAGDWGKREEIRGQGAGDRGQDSEIENLHSPFSNLQSPTFHPFDAVDDRYWCHYIGHSVFRALSFLEKHESAASVAGTSSPSPSRGHPVPSHPLPLITDHRSPITSHPGSGHTLLTSGTHPNSPTALISTRKGGIVTAVWPDGSTASDFGWLVHTPKKLLVTHWWSTDWQIEITDTHTITQGWLVAHKEHTSEPWKHILLRVASFILGRRLIKILKRLVIFKKPQQTLHFTRSLSLEGDELVIHDKITGVSNSDAITRAPRTSKRHVASADSFHTEDFEMRRGCGYTEKIDRANGVFSCVTRYQMVDGGE